MGAKKRAEVTHNKELTFEPAILKRSKQLDGRSLYDLSLGDQLRKEEKVREMREKKAAEEEKAVEESRYGYKPPKSIEAMM